eukprot:SAG22_NODE_168_length_16723_cov_6.542409_5_plen_173_part_00
MGVLGNYAHDSWLNTRAFRLGPTQVADGADMTTACTMNEVVGQSTTVQDSTKNFFVASYGFEGFAKTAAESGINVSDRALNVVCEINKDAIVYTAADSGTGKQIRYDVFAQIDMIIYLTAAGDPPQPASIDANDNPYEPVYRLRQGDINHFTTVDNQHIGGRFYFQLSNRFY